MVDRIAALIGVVCIIYGAMQVSPPAAWIVAGGLLLAGAMWRKP